MCTTPVLERVFYLRRSVCTTKTSERCQVRTAKHVGRAVRHSNNLWPRGPRQGTGTEPEKYPDGE